MSNSESNGRCKFEIPYKLNESRNLRTEEWEVSWLARGGAMYDIWIKGKEMSKDDEHKMIEFLYPSSKTMCIF